MTTSEDVMKDSANQQLHYSDGLWQSVATDLPEETSVPIFINGQEVVSILCTPDKLIALVIGFLTSQGFIAGPGDITSMRICSEELLADVRVKGTFTLPGKRTLTSGCGGGVAFDQDSELKPVDCDKTYTAEQIIKATRLLLQSDKAEQSGRHRGMHFSALSDGEKLIAACQDIGRHNTLDKILGECLLRKIPTTGLMMLSTGRISSDMLIKAVKMGIPLVVSINSATKRAVELGNRFGVTVIGYARGSQFTIFSGRERISRTVEALP